MGKIVYEKRIVEKMIRIYCRSKHDKEELCDECRELLDYALLRLDKCKYGDKKSACGKCTTHCYKPVMREKNKESDEILRSPNASSSPSRCFSSFIK